MKTLLFIPILGIVLFSSSCRTTLPIDPMTGEPSPRCLPDSYQGSVHGTK